MAYNYTVQSGARFFFLYAGNLTLFQAHQQADFNSPSLPTGGDLLRRPPSQGELDLYIYGVITQCKGTSPIASTLQVRICISG